MYIPNTEKIELFGKAFLISERKASDVNKMILFATQNQEKDYFGFMYQNAVVISDALKINIERLKWYQIFKRFKYKRILSYKYLIDKLTQNQFVELPQKIYELEGIPVPSSKKKVNTNQEAV